MKEREQKKRERECVFLDVCVCVACCSASPLRGINEEIDARRQNDELVILNTTRHGKLCTHK